MNNILDVRNLYHLPLPRVIKDLRINEAQTFQFKTDELFLYVDVYNAKLFTLVYIDCFDRAEKRRHRYWRFRVGSRVKLPASLYASEARYRDMNFSLSVKNQFESGHVLLAGRVVSFRAQPDLEMSIGLDLRPEVSTPLVTVMPFRMNRVVYSTHIPAQAHGYVAIGSRRFMLQGETAMIADQKGYYPYITTLDWVVGLGQDSRGRNISFNLSDNHIPNQSQYNENALWVDSAMTPLPAITITRPYGPAGVWNIQDVEGMVDLLFTPEVGNSMHVNAIFAESEYQGPFGSFTGTIKTSSGETIAVEGLYGMGKKKRLRA